MNNGKKWSLSTSDIEYMHNDYDSHVDDGNIIKKFGIVICLDVLGWKTLANEQTIHDYFNLINWLRLQINQISLRFAPKGTPTNVDIVTLSDTLAILIDRNFPFHEINIFNILSEFITKALEYKIAFRGAISRGTYITNKLKNVFVGEAFYEAVKFCESTEWSGILLTPSLKKAITENNSIEELRELNIVQYNNIPFKDIIRENYATIIKDIDLVIAPNNLPMHKSGKIIHIDFENLYKEIMVNEKEKYDNTIKFINYLKESYWDINKI